MKPFIHFSMLYFFFCLYILLYVFLHFYRKDMPTVCSPLGGRGGFHAHTRKKKDLESCEIRKYQENLNLKTS